jgi:ankyrin repeat protein
MLRPENLLSFLWFSKSPMSYTKRKITNSKLRHDAAKKLLHQRDQRGFTTLNCAFLHLRPILIEELLNMGADLLASDPNGVTALHQIAAQHKGQRNSLLREGRDDLHLGHCLSLWSKFLALGGDINVRDNSGAPPLFTYLSYCYTEDFASTYEKLLAEADVHARNNDGETALHIIAKKEGEGVTDRKLFEFMVAKGLDPLVEDAKGRSSLDVAAVCGKKEILDLFQYQS